MAMGPSTAASFGQLQCLFFYPVCERRTGLFLTGPKRVDKRFLTENCSGQPLLFLKTNSFSFRVCKIIKSRDSFLSKDTG